MIIARVKGRVETAGQPSSFFDHYLSEEDIDMPSDRLAELIGDGDARISVSMELKDSDFGTGFGAHVSVSLACAQEESSMNEAAELAMDLASTYVQDAHEVAHAAFKRTHPEERGKPQAEPDKPARTGRRAKGSRK
jgi:hypothetical protein